ncbi:MAG: hypothetical protein V2B19_08825 [Pseudomonadota bacterium]
MKIRVTCHAGYRGEETPRCFWLGERRIDIVEILDRWAGPDYRYFKVKDADQSLYILQHDPVAWSWRITFFQDADCRKVFEDSPEESIDEQFRNRNKDFSIH